MSGLKRDLSCCSLLRTSIAGLGIRGLATVTPPGPSRTPLGELARLLLALVLARRGELVLPAEPARFLIGLRRRVDGVDPDAMLLHASDRQRQARLQREHVDADAARLHGQLAGAEPRAQAAAVVERLQPQRLLGVAVVAHGGPVTRLQPPAVDGRHDLDRPGRERPDLELRDRAGGDGRRRARQRDELERPDPGRRAVVARRGDVDAHRRVALAAAGARSGRGTRSAARRSPSHPAARAPTARSCRRGGTRCGSSRRRRA